MNKATLLMVLVTERPAREVAPILAERFDGVRVEAGSVVVPGIMKRTNGRLRPAVILAYCREKSITIISSAVVTRTVEGPRRVTLDIELPAPEGT